MFETLSIVVLLIVILLLIMKRRSNLDEVVAKTMTVSAPGKIVETKVATPEVMAKMEKEKVAAMEKEKMAKMEPMAAKKTAVPVPAAPVPMGKDDRDRERERGERDEPTPEICRKVMKLCERYN